MGDGWVELERPLPYNVRPEWRAQLHRYNATVQDSGIQDLSIKFEWSECLGGSGGVAGGAWGRAGAGGSVQITPGVCSPA